MSFHDRFSNRFNAAVEHIQETPGRVNLIGEHVDYNGGTVLPMAIPQCVRIGIARRDDDRDQIWSEKFQGFAERQIGAPKQNHWADYISGALEKAREQGWLTGAVSVYAESDVPEGAGLSSSAAIVSAVLAASSRFGNANPDPTHLAQLAREVENDFIGVPCGIMDQMAVGHCRPGEAIALNTSDLSFDVIKLPADWGITIVHSGVTRSLNDGRYSERFAECETLKEMIGREDICQLTKDELASLPTLPDNLAARLAHVVGDHQRTLQAANAMRAEDLDLFGALLRESHNSYSQLFEASTPEIDALVDTAIGAGAKGARLTGGGFGGCMVMAHRPDEQDSLIKSILKQHPDAKHIASLQGGSV
ncbi:MAG: galactokinase [Pseudomonadota bacterium]